MNRTASSLTTLGAILLLLLCTQVMNGTLSLLSFERQQLATVLSGYDAVGANIAGKISRSLRLGKSLDNFVGMPELLAQVRQAAKNLDNVGIVGKNGATLSALAPAPLFPAELVAAVPAGSQKSVHLQRRTSILCFFSWKGGAATRPATSVLPLPKNPCRTSG